MKYSSLPIVVVLCAICGAAIAAEVASAPIAQSPLDLGQLIEKLGMIGILGAAIIYLQRRNEASEKRSQDFAERALSTLAKSTEYMGEITDALSALKVAIAAETEETREMRRAIQDSGRRAAELRG